MSRLFFFPSGGGALAEVQPLHETPPKPPNDTTFTATSLLYSPRRAAVQSAQTLAGAQYPLKFNYLHRSCSTTLSRPATPSSSNYEEGRSLGRITTVKDCPSWQDTKKSTMLASKAIHNCALQSYRAEANIC
jgi:hypothetical protein